MNLEIKSAVGERVRSGMPRNLHNSEQQVFVFTFAAITFDSGIAAAITDLLALAALAPAIYQTLLLDAKGVFFLSRTTPLLFSFLPPRNRSSLYCNLDLFSLFCYFN